MLPVDVYHTIAVESEGAYRAMLAIPQFAREITASRRVDYMIHFGHAVKIARGKIVWTRHGKPHRLDGPAVEGVYGCVWKVNGAVHRVGGPAVVLSDGYREWRINGQLHREDGPAMESEYGWSRWYFNGQLHREGGPAVQDPDGSYEWWFNGYLHRDCGPAIKKIRQVRVV